MADLAPGNLATQTFEWNSAANQCMWGKRDNDKLIVTAPISFKQYCHFKIINSSSRRISYGITLATVNGSKAKYGILDGNQEYFLSVKFPPGGYYPENNDNDSLTIEWTNTPDVDAEISPEILLKRGQNLRRKII